MSRVQKRHGLALIGYCLMTMAGHCDARLAMVLGHPIASIIRALSPPVFSGSAHDGGCIFVPTPGMPTPPLVHVDLTMLASSQTPHGEAVQIEQIPAEDIEPVEALQRSRRPRAHALDCGTGDGMYFVYTFHLLELLLLCI